MRARLLGLLGFLALLGHDAVAQTVVVTGARITWYGKFVLGRAKRGRVPGGANEVSVQASKVKPPRIYLETDHRRCAHGGGGTRLRGDRGG